LSSCPGGGQKEDRKHAERDYLLVLASCLFGALVMLSSKVNSMLLLKALDNA